MSHKRIAATFVTGSTFSNAVSTDSWEGVSVELPTFTIGAATSNVYASVAYDSTGTFRRLKAEGIYSAGSGILDWEIPAGAGNYIVSADVLAGYNQVKLELSTAATSGYTAYVHVIGPSTV